jgi:ribosomal subunit interface protein
MRINIKGTGVTLTPEIHAYFDKCAVKIEKMLAKDPSAFVDAEFELHRSHTAGDEFRVEVTVTGAGTHLRAESRDSTLHAAIDAVENQLLGELRKNKGKRIDVVRRQAARVKDFIRSWRE